MHQDISRELNGVFFNYFRGKNCRFYAAPFDVRLFDKKKSVKANKDVFTVVQPDICIVCDVQKLDKKGCLGAPDLVVEILSPGNSAKEMKTKKHLYEENAVREYWIVDPEHLNLFQFYLTTQNTYAISSIYVYNDIFKSIIFPDLEINLSEIFKNAIDEADAED